VVQGGRLGVPLAEEDLENPLRVRSDEPALPGLPGRLGPQSLGVETGPTRPPLEVLGPALPVGERLCLEEVWEDARALARELDPSLLLLPLDLPLRVHGEVDEAAVDPVRVALQALRLHVPQARQQGGVGPGLVLERLGSLAQLLVLGGPEDSDASLCDGFWHATSN